MASNYTANYQLNQWEGSDKVLREEFNADNAKLDAALAELAETAAGKADQTALSALQAQVDAKASQTDLSALQTQVNAKAAQTDLTALQTQVNGKAAQTALDTLSTTVGKKYGTDNPYIVTGDYTGDGSTSRTITLGFKPSLLMLFSTSGNASNDDFVFLVGDQSAHLMITKYLAEYVFTGIILFTGTGFTMTNDSFNESGWSYRYAAFR